MQAQRVLFTNRHEVTLDPVDFDDAPQHDHDLVIRNRYSVVSAGTELASLAGQNSWFPFPGVPGYACCGEVIAAGAKAGDFRQGDAVFSYGPHASHFHLDTRDDKVGLALKVPRGVPLDLAPLARMASIPMTALRVSTIELGDPVVVTGLGLVGNLAAQLATLQGGRVLGVDINAARRELAASCGLADTLDAGSSEWVAQARTHLDGGAHTLIDATGLSMVIDQALNVVADNGEAILLGTPRDSYTADLTPTYQRVHQYPRVTLKGAIEWCLPTHPIPFTKHSIARNTAIIFDLVRDGRLRFEPLISHRVHPREAAEAYRGLRDEKDTWRGVIFAWD